MLASFKKISNNVIMSQSTIVLIAFVDDLRPQSLPITMCTINSDDETTLIGMSLETNRLQSPKSHSHNTNDMGW